MSHFLLFVIGDDVDEQLAIYNSNLQVETYKEYLPPSEVERIRETYEADDIDSIVDAVPDWTGYEGGYDEGGYFFWNTHNPRAKFDWCILGGRYCGYLKLKSGCSGDVGKRGAGIPDDEPLPHGDLSADRALFGDIDWTGMSTHLLHEAERVWMQAMAEDMMGMPTRYKYGIESWMSRDDFLEARSHPAPFAVLKDSEWYERGNKGWWGVMLDADPVSVWHNRFDQLIADCLPDTLVTVIDCHLQGATS